MSSYDTCLSWFDIFHLAWFPWGHPDYRWQDFLLSSWQYNISLIFFPFICWWTRCSVTKSCPTLCKPMDCSTPGFSVIHFSQSLLKFMSIESIMPSSHLILCCPLLLLLSIFPSIRVFANESALRIRWPKCWSFSFTISPSSEYSGLFSLRMDWFDLFAVEGTLKSLLQNHSSKASVLQCSAFFMAQLSHLYMTTEKTIALTIQIFVRKVVSMLFNALFRLVMDT